MRRGQVWWARLPAPQGLRPVLLLSRQKAIEVRSSVTVAPLTRTARGIPTEVTLGLSDGVPKPCVINLDCLLTIPKAYLSDPLCLLGREKMEAVDRALKFALGLI